MCGRFAIEISPEVLAEVFGVGLDDDDDLRTTFNAAPGTDQLVIGVDGEGVRRARRYRWGFVPGWSAADEGAARPMINARSETAATKPTFRAAFASSRCLVPMTAFYEWESRGGTKQPWLFRLRGGAPFAVGGLTSRFRDADGAVHRSFCLLTTSANTTVAAIHDRMPVIVAPAEFGRWLDPSASRPELVAPILTPFPPERMESWPVSRAVNSPGNDGRELVEPVAREGLPF